jgi:hypothetical protein
VRVVLYDNDLLPPRDQLVCFFWFHTGFIEQPRVVLDKDHIDVACNDNRCRVFDPKFGIEVVFEECPIDESAPVETCGTKTFYNSPGHGSSTFAIMQRPIAKSVSLNEQGISSRASGAFDCGSSSNVRPRPAVLLPPLFVTGALSMHRPHCSD